ncbi:DUF6230 family protein [Klenkia sp. LSe6-5]|uniref:DUF6230 family protein n=1 Tax=Klenkia sesuvii TaxID=3103137 RepID=A0ABU8DUP8_9ACTN
MVAADVAGRSGTRLRAVPVAAAGVVALGTMFQMVSADVLAVNFTASDNAYRIYTDRVVGQQAAGYLGAQARSAGDAPAMQFGFQQADLYGLCAIATDELPVLGAVSFVLTAGEPVDGAVSDGADGAINTTALRLATDSLSGTGENIARLTLGQSADTLDMGGTPFAGPVGGFGLQADVMQIGGLDASSYGIDLQGDVTLPNLSIRVVPGAVDKGTCVP